MPHLTARYNESGPIVDVWLGASAPRRKALQRQRLDAPEPMRLHFLIDTGADTSMVAEQHMRSLGLPARGARAILTASTEARPTACETYDVELAIRRFGDEAFVVPALEILARPLFNLSIEGLLGRDVLSRVRFVLDGPQRWCRIEYG